MPNHSSTKKANMSKSKRITLLVASIMICVLLVGWLKSSHQILAQDLQLQQPRFETTYREIRDGDVTRRVPQTRVIYPTQAIGYSQSSVQIPSKPLPHADKIGPLVSSILGTSTRTTTAGRQDQEENPRDVEKQKADLEKMLGDQFDAMSQEQQEQMDQLAQRLERLKTQHRARTEARDEIILRRMNQLLRRPDPLAWDPNPGRRDLTPVPPRAMTYRRSTSNVYQPSTTSLSVTGQQVEKSGWVPQYQAQNVPIQVPANPSVRSVQPFSQFGDSFTQSANDKSLEKAKDDLFAAIGRASVDKNERSQDRLRQAIKEARELVGTMLRSRPPQPSMINQINELNETIEVASAQIEGDEEEEETDEYNEEDFEVESSESDDFGEEEEVEIRRLRSESRR